MRNIISKEISQLINNPVGYIIPAVFALLLNYLFAKDIFLIGSGSLRPFFAISPWLLIVFVAAISMRSFAEEKKTGTLDILLSLPLSTFQIVCGKFFALLLFSGIALALTLSVPLTISSLTPLPPLEIATGYLGLIFLSSLYISIGLFFSSQTDNQIISFLLSAITLFILTSLSSDLFSSWLPRIVQDMFVFISPLSAAQPFFKGVITTSSVAYFLLTTGLCMLLTISRINKRP